MNVIVNLQIIVLWMDYVTQLMSYIKELITQKKILWIKKTYIGISSTKWEIRYANHKYSFSHEHLKHQTAWSKHFWSLKNKGPYWKSQILHNVLIVDVIYALRKKYK